FEIDGDGNVWAGGRGEYNGQSGITFREIDRNQVHYYQARFISNMYNDQINAVAIDYPYVWFGSEYGLLRFNLDKNEWKTFDTSLGLRDNYVYDVEVDSNNIWIGTLLGLCRLDKTKMFEKDYRIQNIAERDILNIKVYDIEVMQNLLWIGTEFGVYIYDKNIQSGGFEDEPEGPQNDQVTAVAVLEDKEVWFGTPDGIEVYDLGKKRWLGAPERRFYTSTYVNFIDVDSSAAWVATNEGVLKFDKKRNWWRKFDVVDGLPSNVVNWIEIDGDYVWFATPEGLTRFYWNAPYRID
ncbi:MAG: two-component regulator propeller domain-containing protein, partial [bacterium]|nr:two-component regulator propeller domain-containing protein [bacterium]